jgi:multimeric flavodoxin WrbA
VSFVVGFSGSPRPDGNTHHLVETALASAAAAGAEVRFYDLNATPVRGCQACMACKEPDHRGRCAVDDAFSAMNEDLKRADGLILGAPVYIGYWSGQAKNFIDRLYCWRSRQGWEIPAGKRALVVCTCGAKAESYQDLLDRMVAFFDHAGMAARGLMAASLSGKDAARGRAELTAEAAAAGRWLAGE